jgi:putative tricarboxylic transport membrane protein
LCCVYGYAAFFTMDDQLPRILQRNPIWPSTFPKMLTILGLIVGLIVLFTPKPSAEGKPAKDGAIDLTRLGDYHIGQAIGLLVLMVAYALTLASAGLPGLATVGFLVLGAALLGERRFHILIPVAVIATGSIWYLVQEVLGIFLRPWPHLHVGRRTCLKDSHRPDSGPDTGEPDDGGHGLCHRHLHRHVAGTRADVDHRHHDPRGHRDRRSHGRSDPAVWGLLRGDLRRLHLVDPAQRTGGGGHGRHQLRRLPHGAQGPGRQGADHRRHRQLCRRHHRRDPADDFRAGPVHRGPSVPFG